MTTGLVFDIQRYSIHDGPGIRTVVFLKGCPLHCLWCSNPESQSFHRELEFRANSCTHCGRCIAVCPVEALNPDPWLTTGPKVNRDLCTSCGKCAEACPSGALRLIGTGYTVEDVVAAVLRDAAFYRHSGGGVTLSGGEPLAQPTFARQLLTACYDRNVHTAVETTGSVSWKVYEEILPFTNLFLFDVKHVNSEVHRQLVGVPNEQIIDNLVRLATTGVPIILRVPLIPGHNLDEAHLNFVAHLAETLAVLEVHLLPFHQFGKDKYARLDKPYHLAGLAGLREAPGGNDRLRWAQDLIAQRGVKVTIGG